MSFSILCQILGWCNPWTICLLKYLWPESECDGTPRRFPFAVQSSRIQTKVESIGYVTESFFPIQSNIICLTFSSLHLLWTRVLWLMSDSHCQPRGTGIYMLMRWCCIWKYLFFFSYQLYNVKTIISELISKETTLWWGKVDFTKHTEFDYQFLPLEGLFKVWSLNLDPDSEYSWLSNSLAHWVEAGKWL